MLREGPNDWVMALNAATADNNFPSGGSAGVALPTATTTPTGIRLHVKVNMTAASGTAATGIHLYGYDGTTWFWLGSFNDGNVMTADTGKWSSAATNLMVAEWFDVPALNWTRFYLRPFSISGGTPTITAHIGFPRE
jgi:hypothetical protein